MKISVVLCLVILVIFTVTQLCSSYEKRGNQGYDLLLGGNDDECCQQNGSNIIIEKPGSVEIILDGDNELVFEVCSMNCDGDFIVCYESGSPNQNVLQLCDTKCGFYVTSKANKISYMKPIENAYIGKSKTSKCDIFIMKNGATPFREGYVTTCAPKIENGLVKLSVTNASSDCPVLILNATIMLATTTSAPTTLTTITPSGITTGTNSKIGRFGNETGTTTAEPGGFFETYWWVFLVIVIFVVAIVVAGIIIYCVKCKTPKKPTPSHAPRMPQGPQSPVVLQPSAEPVKSRNIPTSILEPSSIISRKSVLEMAKKEEDAKQEETDLASLKP